MTETEWLVSTDPAAMLRHLAAPRLQEVVARPAGQVNTWDVEHRYEVLPVSDRKLRLFACACWHAAPPERLTPKWLESLLQLEELAEGIRTGFTRQVEGFISATIDTTELMRWVSGLWTGENISDSQRETNRRAAAALARDIFNPFRQQGCQWSGTPRDDTKCKTHGETLIKTNGGVYVCPNYTAPFRQEWRTATVVNVAQAIYDGRCFEDIDILADALEDAGCTDASILEHCRGQDLWETCPSCEDQSPDPETNAIECRQCDCTGMMPDEDAEPMHVRGCWVVDLILGKE